MRRLILIASAGCIALGLVSVTALAALAEASTQKESSDGASELQNTAPYDVEAQATFISQGSAIGATKAQLAAVQADVAEEESLPHYSQVVDNENGVRFSAPGWKVGRDSPGAGQVSYGGSYVSSGSDGRPARFKVRVPTSNDYTVYAWWPAISGSSEGAHFGIDTAAGRQWSSVDQSIDGGGWAKIGTYAMKTGERTIQLSAGQSVADAVAIVRGDLTQPPGEGTPITTASSGEATYSASSVSDPTGHDAVRVARHWIGKQYQWGTCTRTLMSCTCETKKTYARFGHDLGMGEMQQWRYDTGVRKVRYKSNLRQGDEVFFKEDGPYNPITHVGIRAPNGMVVHASAYFGKVVESDMKYVNGYFGAKRYRLH